MTLDEVKALSAATKLLLLTCAEPETRAIAECFHSGGEPALVRGGQQPYRYLGLHDQHHVFTVMTSELGSPDAQSTVHLACADIDPGTVVAVGIAFGVDASKQRIGDVLVSRAVQGYDIARVEPNGHLTPRQMPRASSRTPSQRFLDRQRYGRPASCSHAWPRITLGTLLSGGRLIDNINYRDSLVALWPSGVVGGEMEAVGVIAAAEADSGKRDWIIVKAICDFADGNKSNLHKEAHQALAAWNAALVVKAVYDPDGMADVPNRALLHPLVAAELAQAQATRQSVPVAKAGTPAAQPDGAQAGVAALPEKPSPVAMPMLGDRGATPTEQWCEPALVNAAKSRHPALIEFWAQWASKGGVALPDMATFRAVCNSHETALSLLVLLRSVVVDLGPRFNYAAEIKELVQPLTLAVADVYILHAPVAPSLQTQDRLHVGVDDSVTAAAVAGSHFKQGVKYTRHSQLPGHRAASVLPGDTEPVEYGVTTGRDVVLLELMAVVDLRYAVADAGVWRSTIERLKSQRRADPKALRQEIDLLANDKDHRARPMYGLHSASTGALAKDADLRQGLLREFGVATYFYGAEPCSPEQRSDWGSLQDTLQRYVFGIFDALDPPVAPEPALPAVAPVAVRHQVFVSYSHLSPNWRERVSLHLTPLQRKGLIVLWDDTLIKTGNDWRDKIDQALALTRIAVLLISPGFMASDFIHDHEMPGLLDRHAKGGLEILPLLVETCDWQIEPWLERIQLQRQAVALDRLSPDQVNVALTALSKRIRELCNPGPANPP